VVDETDIGMLMVDHEERPSNHGAYYISDRLVVGIVTDFVVVSAAAVVAAVVVVFAFVVVVFVVRGMGVMQDLVVVVPVVVLVLADPTTCSRWYT